MADKLPWNLWVKALRAELGAKQSRKKITQSELAELLGNDLSMVGKWEMKNPQLPEVAQLAKVLKLASPDLRARAPQALDLLEMSDPDRTVIPESNGTGDRNVTTREGIWVGQELDEIEDTPLRKRARDAALAAIREEVSRANPPVSSADRKAGPRSKHS